MASMLLENWFTILLGSSLVFTLIAWLQNRHIVQSHHFGTSWSGDLSFECANGGRVTWIDDTTCEVETWHGDYMLTLSGGCQAGFLPLVRIGIEDYKLGPVVPSEPPFLDGDDWCIIIDTYAVPEDATLLINIDDGPNGSVDFRVVRNA